MAKYDERKNAALAVALRRQSSSPLDVSSVFNSIADFEAYVKQDTNYGPYSDGKENTFLQKINPYSYAGQVVTVLDAAAGSVKTFVINKAGPLGTGSIDTNVQRVDGATGPHIRYNNGSADVDLVADTWYYSAYNKKYFKFDANGAYQIVSAAPSGYSSENAIPESVTEFETTIGGQLQSFKFTEDVKERYTEVGSVPAVDGKSIKAVDVVTADGKTVKTLEISSTTSTLADIESKKDTDDEYAAGTTFQLTLDLNGNVRWVKVDTQTMEGVAATLQTYGNQISDLQNISSNHTNDITNISSRLNLVETNVNTVILPWKENASKDIANLKTNVNTILNTTIPDINNSITNIGKVVENNVNFISNHETRIVSLENDVTKIKPDLEGALNDIIRIDPILDNAVKDINTIYPIVNTVSSNYVKDVAYDNATGTFTFNYVKNNAASALTVDLALERIVTNFFYTSNGETPNGNFVYKYNANGVIGIGASVPSGAAKLTNSLVLELTDGSDESAAETFQAVSLSKLIDTYTGSNSGNVVVDVNGNVISANIGAAAIDANNAGTIFEDDALTSSFLDTKIVNASINSSIIANKVADGALTNTVLVNKIATGAFDSNVFSKALVNNALNTAILEKAFDTNSITASVLDKALADNSIDAMAIKADSIDASIILDKFKNNSVTEDVLNHVLPDNVITENILRSKIVDCSITTGFLEDKLSSGAINTSVIMHAVADDSIDNSVLSKVIANNSINTIFLLEKFASGSLNSSVFSNLIPSDGAHADNLSVNYANSANYAYNATYSSYAESATNASFADNANHAGAADHADHADQASSADHATEATHADSADRATNADNANYATQAGSASTAGHANTADKVVNSLKIGYTDDTGNFVENKSYNGSTEVQITIEDLDGVRASEHPTLTIYAGENEVASDTGVEVGEGFVKDRKLTIEAGNFIKITTENVVENDPSHQVLKIDAESVHRSFGFQNNDGSVIASVEKDDECGIVFKEGNNVNITVTGGHNAVDDTHSPYVVQINATDTTYTADENSITRITEVYNAENGTYAQGGEFGTVFKVKHNGIETRHIADEAVTDNKIYSVDASKIISNDTVKLILNCGGARRA